MQIAVASRFSRSTREKKKLSETLVVCQINLTFVKKKKKSQTTLKTNNLHLCAQIKSIDNESESFTGKEWVTRHLQTDPDCVKYVC